MFTTMLQAMARSAGRQSPVPNAAIERTDSVPSLNSMPFTTSSISHGCSRGPSPLTIGMSDTIPLAVAYSERVNSLFKGTDESKWVQVIMWRSFRCGHLKFLKVTVLFSVTLHGFSLIARGAEAQPVKDVYLYAFYSLDVITTKWLVLR